MIDPVRDPTGVLQALAQRGVALELNTADLCFIAALHVRAEGGALVSFHEDQLVDVFEQVCQFLDPQAENVRKRATHAIGRLRQQRMLARIDGAGVVRAGEYALSRLATAIVEFFLHDEALTRESLTLLTGTLLTSLAEVLNSAKSATTRDQWQARVLGPLRVTVADLVGGIERRQRGLDLQQEQFQKQIAELLQADWFGAVERCQSLLDSTSATLRELNEVLLRDSHQLQALLQDIHELAANANVEEVEHAAHRVMEQVDRIAAWGSARQRAWSEYYQYVHRYLRDVVRLDPARALTHRLREQLTGKRGVAFALTVASSQPMQVLRDVLPPPERPPVKRPRASREKPPAEAAPDDAKSALEDAVRDALASGASGLVDVTRLAIADVPSEQRFVTAGRVAEVVARLAKPAPERERPWQAVHDSLWIEEWQVASGEEP